MSIEVTPDQMDRFIESIRAIDELDIDPSVMGILIRVGRIHDIVNNILEQAIRASSVRHKKDHDLLVALLQADRPLRNNQLQSLLHLTSPSVSQRVSRLIKAGLIDRKSVPGDTRANQLTLTSLGKAETISNISRSLEVQHRLVAAALTVEQQGELSDLLRKLAVSLGDAPLHT